MGKDYAKLSYEELKKELDDNDVELAEVVGWLCCFRYLNNATKSKRQRGLLRKLGEKEALHKTSKSLELIMCGLEMKAEISRRSFSD